MKNNSGFALVFLAASFLSACATTPFDYSNYRQARPKTILVLPPINKSTEVLASYSYLSTVTQPLAEKGYYVFPVAVIDQMMKENGLPTPGEMHQASLKKIAEIINPDAVLYITLEEYGSKYHVINSSTQVGLSARLVSTRDGSALWTGKSHVTVNPSTDTRAGLFGALLAAAIHQAINSSTDAAHPVCRQANHALFNSHGHGLLYGPYHKEYLKD